MRTARVIKVAQKLDTHAQMAVLGQYSERGINVMLSDRQGVAKQIGRVTQLVPMNDSFKATIDYLPGVKGLKQHETEGFVFSNFYGVYFLSKPIGA